MVVHRGSSVKNVFPVYLEKKSRWEMFAVQNVLPMLRAVLWQTFGKETSNAVLSQIVPQFYSDWKNKWHEQKEGGGSVTNVEEKRVF